MSTGTIFVTASNADFRHVNRFLLYIRDWEYGSGDRFHIVLDKNKVRFDPNGYSNTVTEAGSLTAENFPNAWTGLSMSDVETWMLEVTKLDPSGDPSLWIVLDDEGVQQETCVLAQRRMPEDDYDIRPTPTWNFDKTRVPWDEVYNPWCNLDIANMSFDEFVDAEAGPDTEGWWRFESLGLDLSEESKAARDAEISKFEEEGKA